MFARTTAKEEEGSKVQTITRVLLSFPNDSIELIDSRPHGGAAVLSVDGLPSSITILRSTSGALAKCQQVCPLVALGADGAASDVLGVDRTIAIIMSAFYILTLMLHGHKLRARETSRPSFDVDKAYSLHVVIGVLELDILQALQHIVRTNPDIVSVEGAPKPAEHLSRSKPGGLKLISSGLDSTLDPNSGVPVALLCHHFEGF